VCYKIQDELNNTWNNLKNNVKVKSRFFSNIDDFDNCNGMKIISSNAKIPKGTKLYRTRIIPIGENRLSKDQMSCPPAKMATAGRANPLGIPYLYLCAEEETTYYEVRSIYLDRLSIGTFNIEKDLNILDFTSKISPYYAYANSDLPLDKEIYKFKLLKLISADLSKPLRRFDTELEYIPTQLVCEYAKLQNIDGVKFYSSLHKGGINIVLFDPSNATCEEIETKEVKDIKITI
jgi:RES domain.